VISRVISAEKLAFFLGAGASVEFGAPTMKKMTTEFYEWIWKEVSHKKDLFVKIYDILQVIYGEGNVDLEAIMSVITGLKEREHFRENIGELGGFLLRQQGIVNANQKVEEYDVKILTELEENFKDFIRNKFSFNTQQIDRIRKVYHDFFKQLSSATNSNHGEETNPYTYTAHKWVFFTTNYDNAIEQYWVKYRKYVDLDLGFSHDTHEKLMNADLFVENYLSTTNGAMKLVKLHGSINWIKNREGKIEEHLYGSSLDAVKSGSGTGDVMDEIMIYPLSQKQLYFTPYVQLFRILEGELDRRDVWIVIGYSFRDIIIRNMFEKSLQNSKRKIFVVHPRVEEVTELFQKGVRSQIIPLKYHFGREIDYQEVNKNIAQSLRTSE
jgi:SIR2-like domain